MAIRKNPHAVALGRRGGKVSSPAKAAAARRNAQHAGRKPKFQLGDPARVNDQAPADYRERIGSIAEIGPRKSEYRVDFKDGEKPHHGYLRSWWLDRIE